jgi:hypothetical protein
MAIESIDNLMGGGPEKELTPDSTNFVPGRSINIARPALTFLAPETFDGSPVNALEDYMLQIIGRNTVELYRKHGYESRDPTPESINNIIEPGITFGVREFKANRPSTNTGSSNLWKIEAWPDAETDEYLIAEYKKIGVEHGVIIPQKNLPVFRFDVSTSGPYDAVMSKIKELNTAQKHIIQFGAAVDALE